VQVAVVDVPDRRLDALYRIFNPRKQIYAKITYADVGGLAKGISEGALSGPFRNQLSQMDGFLHVVRVFDDPGVPHPEETIDPQRDLDILDAEFLLADMVTVENRMARLRDEMAKGKNRPENAAELALFERLQAALEAERPLRSAGLAGEELQILRGYGFLSLKPRLILLNVGDDETRSPGEIVDARDEASAVLTIHGKLEAEISQLDPDEAATFLSEYHIEEPVRSRVIRASYGLLHMQTFFTVGDEEVRAWPIRRGVTAHEAAGAIHTDLQRGFIRAEIISCDMLIRLGGMAEARASGKLRLEGKDYLVQDCDVMTVRFNI
jgi:hypothetical protein